MTKPTIGTPITDLQTLRNAIPLRCFERSLCVSFSYVARDFLFIALLSYAAIWLIDFHSVWAIPLWILYSFVQGLFFTGLWILAHECGHDAFSSHHSLNSAVGFILHSILLVPFFSWKYSHSRHHRYANHMEKDTVFVPLRKAEYHSTLFGHLLDHHAADAPFISLCYLVIHQLFGWPAYILLNAGAGKNSLVKLDKMVSPYRQSHLDPTAYIFTSTERPYVVLSNVGLISVLTILYHVSKSLGVYNAFLLYGLPYLWMNHWLVAITYLHHTHPNAPHYEGKSWTFGEGALSTVDRDFGFIGRYFFHGIIEYHVVHHLFPRIPFYHAEEATSAIAPLLGERYLTQRSSFLHDLWDTFSSCRYVEESTGSQPGHMHWVGGMNL